MKERIKNIAKPFKKFIDNIIDYSLLKEQNRLLRKRVEELEKNQQPLIDLKNNYLSKLRVANLELGKLKRILGDKENE